MQNNVINAVDNTTVEFPESENFEKHEELSDRLADIYPDLHLSIFYSYYPLVSEKMFPIIRNSVDVFPFNMVNRAILLNELMENNWKKFEMLLYERTLDNKEYDVFVGVSNTLKVPSDLKHVLDYKPKVRFFCRGKGLRFKTVLYSSVSYITLNESHNSCGLT